MKKGQEAVLQSQKAHPTAQAPDNAPPEHGARSATQRSSGSGAPPASSAGGGSAGSQSIHHITVPQQHETTQSTRLVCPIPFLLPVQA